MPNLKPHAARILAILLVALAWIAAQPAKLSASARADLTSGFKFTKLPMPEPSEYPNSGTKIVRPVHPSLKRISAWISATGSSIALGDIDGDGLDNDYCFVDPRTDAILVGCVPGTKQRYPLTVLNPGKLVDATMAPMGALICDLNEDGLKDILVYYWGRTPIAFLHQGRAANVAFLPKELIVASNPNEARWFSCAVTQADLDGDGHKDLLVCNYFKDGSRILDANAKGQEELHDSKSKSYNGGLKHFLLWQNDGSKSQYKEVKSNLSDDVLRGWTVAAASADINGDLLPEIYLANDLGPDRLLLNQSKPGVLNFTAIEGKRDMTTPASSVLGCDSYKGMGVDFGDVNADGKFDIFVSNIAAEYGFMESHFLWLSKPDKAKSLPQYKQASEDLNLSRSGWGWDARLADFNNDGKLEAFQATGFLKGKINRWPELQALGTGNDQMMHDARNWPSFKPGDDINGHEANAFFARANDGRYYNISKDIGLADPTVSRGIAIADVDGDGDLDFAVANQWEPSFFYRNDSDKQNKFLSLHLFEGPKNLTPVGAIAKLRYPDGREVVAQVDGGSGHSGKRSKEIHFGLGSIDAKAPLPVDLLWRDSQGVVHEEKRTFEPGYHLVHLGSEVKGN
jgi:enediyne biosynthesis protein E4